MYTVLLEPSATGLEKAMEEVAISDHARFEMDRRHISEDMVLAVWRKPDQVLKAAKGRTAYQSKYYDAGEGKEMLLRLVLEPEEGRQRVITAYKTSRIEKYWHKETLP